MMLILQAIHELGEHLKNNEVLLSKKIYVELPHKLLIFLNY